MPGKLEFHYVPWNHFVFTVLCLVVCGVGIAHTRGTNLEGRFPYFAFAAILGGMVGDYNVIKHLFETTNN